MVDKGESEDGEAKSTHSTAFAAKVAPARLRGDRALAGLEWQFDVHPDQITDWQKQSRERVVEVFKRARLLRVN